LGKCRLEDMPDLVSVYHEILINEIALMRSNAVVEEGVDTGEAIAYVSTITTHNPKADRGLDYMILAYSIINGFRRLECGYNILNPMSIEDTGECKAKIVERMKKSLETRESPYSARGEDSLEELVARIAVRMMECGLIHVMFKANSTTDDTVSPLQVHTSRSQNPSQNQVIEVRVRDARELYSYKLYYRMNEFFDKLNVDLDKLIEKFKEKFGELFSSYEGDINTLSFKTLHGILFKYASHASSLPLHPAVLEANILPFMIEPAPFHSEKLDITLLKQQFSKLAKEASRCTEKEIFTVIGEALGEVLNGPLTDFQYEYLRDMLRKCSEREGGILAAITSPAGTGKTLIFFTYTIAKLLAAKQAGRQAKALILYPRKALARDQLSKMLELLNKVNERLKDKGLKLKIGIRDGDSLKKNAPQIQELRGLKISGYKLCHGFSDGNYEVFLAKNGSCESGDHVQIDWIMDLKGEEGRVLNEADIVITNHSMLTKLVNDIFKPGERSSFSNFLKNLEILIVDEAHMYLDEELLKVLAPTLLKLFYLRPRLKEGPPQNLENLANNLNIDLIVSSATLTDHNIVKRGDQKLDSKSIIGFFKVKTKSQAGGIPESLENFLKVLLSEPVYNKFKDGKLIYKDYDSIVSRYINGYRWKGPFKVKIALVVHPYPRKKSWTSLAEVLISTLHWLKAIRLRGLSENAQTLVFIDLKESLRDIFKKFLERQILEAQDHVDRVLLTKLYEKEGSLSEDSYSESEKGENVRDRDKAIEEIVKTIDELRGNLMEVLYHNEVLGNFHALHPYITIEDLNKLNSRINNSNDFIDKLKNFKLYNELIRFLESLNEYTKQALKILERRERNSYRRLLEKLESLTYEKGVEDVILAHHGDLNARDRAIIEAHMKGDRRPTPLAIMTTSTLEVGVDVESISLVIQYASYPRSADLMQRFGRSGRHISSFLVSTLILILRNTGEDVRLIMDQDAVEYVYNFRMPYVVDILKDEDAVFRTLTPILIDEYIERGSVRNVTKEAKRFLEMLQGSYNGKYIDNLKTWESYLGLIELIEDQSTNLNEVLGNVRATLVQIERELSKLVLRDKVKDLERILDDAKDLREDLIIVLRAVTNLKGFQLNLIPLIIRLAFLEQKLYKIIGELDSTSMLRELDRDLINKISELTSYTYSRLAAVIGKEMLRYILSHVPPGATEKIGSMRVIHFIYQLSKNKIEKEEAWNAFKTIRPLHTVF